MNISYNWLKEYVDFNLDPQSVADALTSIGLEVSSVEQVQSLKGGLKGFVIGEVITCQAHPNSDHLHVTKVNLGGDRIVPIVCGAPNVASGQKVVVATIGSVIYDGDESFTIRKSKLRGEESHGMICSEKELGLGSDQLGIMVLSPDAVEGTPAAEYFKIESDHIIEVDITPNHASACSHWGVAREFYAWLIQNGYNTELKRPSIDGFSVDNEQYKIDIEIVEPNLSPRYAGVTLTDITVKESPDWLKKRLEAIGVRSINNVVDVSNYIMHAYGQPLHCFDADRIEGRKVVVRTVPEGTPFKTLDGEDIKLSNSDLMICNSSAPMCIGGVLGGADSGTTKQTRNVFIESAYFNPTSVRKSARRHQLNTDASFRFERGVDPEGVIYALKRAAILIKELGEGKISMPISDVYPTPLIPTKIDLEYLYIDRLLGKVIDRESIKKILVTLGMTIEAETAKGIRVEVPLYRIDVQRPCDVVEELLRIYGYNNIEFDNSLHLSLTEQGEADHYYHLQNIISEQLVGCGFSEILNNSLSKSAYYENTGIYYEDRLVRLLNPLSSDLNVMRQTLIFGGLESISYNICRQNSNLSFFEFGKCYFFNAPTDNSKNIQTGKGNKDPLDAYSEHYRLGLWLTGQKISSSWAHPEEPFTVFLMKAHVQNIIKRIGLSTKKYKIEEFSDNIFVNGLRYLKENGEPFAWLGVVQPNLLKRFEIETEVFYADLDWDELMKASNNVIVEYKELSKFPIVRRDLALLVDKHIKFSDIKQLAYLTGGKLLKDVFLFDVYEGKNLEPGKKSYAVGFLLQDRVQTLTERQIENIMGKIIGVFENQLSARLR
ncbi:MAG TPA: phenylalanine--tRNA ligase subunit beta [Bacteroidaceae bacterium]|nr:phenylalanine--tRNA ligase subunit beta [Bacteroidaceae bacterium]